MPVVIKLFLALFQVLVVCIFCTFSFTAFAANTNTQDPLPSSLDVFDLLEKDKAKSKIENKPCNCNIAHSNAALPQPPIDEYLPLALAALALLLAFIAVVLAKKSNKPVKAFNEVNDHWYCTVIHPQCYEPLLVLLQAFEQQVLKAKNQGINHEQSVKLFWQLQGQKEAIGNTMKMVITEPLIATAMVEQLDAIFAQMESECLGEMNEPNAELDNKQVKVACIGVAMQKISQRFKVLHQQMVEMQMS